MFEDRVRWTRRRVRAPAQPGAGHGPVTSVLVVTVQAKEGRGGLKTRARVADEGSERREENDSSPEVARCNHGRSRTTAATTPGQQAQSPQSGGHCSWGHSCGGHLSAGWSCCACSLAAVDSQGQPLLHGSTSPPGISAMGVPPALSCRQIRANRTSGQAWRRSLSLRRCITQ